jgi:hypothetical protein
MSGLLGRPNSRHVQKYTGLQVQTSALNLPIAIFWGKRRLAWNLIWKGNIAAIAQHSGGGKGGGGKGTTSYTYTVPVIMALGEGLVSSIPTAWQNQSVTSLSALGLTLFTGSPTQTAWSYVSTAYPSQALSYANTAYVCSSALQLGSMPTIPQIDFECVGNLSGTMPGTPDCNLGDIIPDFLTNTQYGMGLAATDLNATDLAFFKTYQQAQGLFFSPALISQEKANDIIDRWAELSNSWIFPSGDQIKFVPLGDTAITANGATYTPDTTIQYDLTVDDFIGDPPIKVSRMDPADAQNKTTLQITDRALSYNSNPIEYKDQTLVDLYGLRDNNSIQADEICDAAVGSIVASLIGQRAAYQRNTYSFTLPYRFVRLEPGNLVTIIDPNNAAIQQLAVRMKTIEEDQDYNLACTAEEFFGAATTGTVTSSPVQPSSPNTFNNLVDPGNVNAPCVFEPNSSLTGGAAEVWIAASGGANWGGAYVYISFDNVTFSLIGTIVGKARQGILTASLASHADPDTTDTLSVDLTASAGTLGAVTNADADAFRTLAYLSAPASGSVLAGSGELIAYGAIASTGTYTDNLTYLRRGLYGTAPAAHSTNDLFTRIDLGASDTTLVKYELPAAYIGATIHVKLMSFNIYGQGAQDISTVTSYSYTPSGAGYGGGSGGVPTTPTGLTAVGGNLQNVLTWNANPSADNVTGYEIWRAAGTGAAFGSASKIATVNALTYTDPGLSASTGYTYFLKADNAAGSSAATAGANATTTAAAFGTTTGSITASEALSAGNLCNIYTNSGAANVRKANATDATKPANCFVLASVASSAGATVYFAGQIITGLSSLTPGTTYYLDITGGAITATPPSTAGNVVQEVGVALSATSLMFNPRAMIEVE